MDEQTKGAWLLAQSKCLDGITGASRLENIQYAGKTGRLYNLLRRNTLDSSMQTLNSEDITTICQLNNIDRASRESGLQLLEREGRIDIGENKSIAILGATARSVLEFTSQIFDDCEPSKEETAAIHLSELVAQKPITRAEATEYISDNFKLANDKASSVVDICKSTAILDQAENKGLVLLFNNNNFRSGNYAQKAYQLLQSLNAAESQSYRELQDHLNKKGAIDDKQAERILGSVLFKRLVGIGLLDRLEVSNSTEVIGYLTSPNSFQKFGRPFEDDPIDDAKALMASLTYGMTRSEHKRGNITLPDALLRKLISGHPVGGERGVAAIGEDYKELEKRQVIKVTKKAGNRYTMTLLKKDVGELARTIIQGNAPAQDALLMDGGAAKSFKGPAENRAEIRAKHTLDDTQFIASALDQMRSGG
ncbi:hypothetical protein JJD66_27170 [Pseudomonas sp. MF6751]|uniref:hypothetical protein n=1 Tax=Pseudomonas sp. MF6751 TaxID=2797528 RepID=UPI0019091EA5|nr:hypothetical protein [Pseudomonas sp. MF6751]MBK3479767.1 hypothetical protein [Pseudomonas sp. MF6751]